MNAMPSIEVSVEELRLAWNRARVDLADRCFAAHPLMESWVKVDEAAFLESIQTRLRTGYVPSPATPCIVPKAGGMVRSGSLLSIDDHIVYNLLVGRCFASIQESVADLQGVIDFSYQLANSADERKWIKKSGVAAHMEFGKESLRRLERGVECMVATDITAFYENVDIHKLWMDLSALDCHTMVVRALRVGLGRWADPRGQGVPQGYSASDILAKLYLRSFDFQLKRDGFVHVRYVDDTRIFCSTQLDARKGIEVATRLLYERGLNLQSAKTKILTLGDATRDVKGVSEDIEAIQRTLRDELELLGSEGYLTTEELFEALKRLEGDPPEVLERAFEEHFMAGQGQFNKSLFHFLLARLGAAHSRKAVETCLELLVGCPEETSFILRYLKEVELEADDLERLQEILTSGKTIYDYQRFQVLRWFFDLPSANEGVLDAARAWSFDMNRPHWLRSYAVAYVGRFGDTTDFANLQQRYRECDSVLTKADLVAGVYRQERSGRNAFYSQVEGEHDLVRRAVAVARSKK